MRTCASVCVCVSLSASSWSGTVGHRALCLSASRASGLGAIEGGGCLCIRQTERATMQVHVWVHDSPAKLSYWRHPQCVCVCAGVCKRAPVPRCQQLGRLRIQTGWTAPKPSYRRDPHCITHVYFPLTHQHPDQPGRGSG